jgi:hypothetical protein
VREALDAYRERGCVREHERQEHARAALVERWGQIEREGVECGIEAFTNVERIAVNELAREEWRAMGRLSGVDRELETIDGRVPYAVGDRVVIRETIREAGLYNGSVGTVRGIDGARLEIERRDGAVVAVDTHAHPGVQHGYCSTEYREQGSTRYAELQLVTQHVNQRSLTVGMTRHTHAYEMFYAKETVGSYDDLVTIGTRTHSKELASDYRIVEMERSRGQAMSVTALRWELEPIARGEVEGYTRDERKAAFALLNRLERLEPNAQLEVGRDWHRTLGASSDLAKQLDNAERERDRTQSQERTRKREIGF